ncbi:predicted protein [Sclerotinia sclerotiorum 1980 UF-70]|uniref:Uncharacterized protein n=1 Tax=Sclerotinia sclerotiorum (strain ATCC 18683 / 1980 / Ss-1) TaxID=665079 RepID=A7F1J7_SCLS1|nr:predicted protein [Sclerotinia sclerotiorum 1980 UF-70]EDN95589.1 predicted protein [Sclerotinia sclerotiorum 1980 UF-70]
MAKAIGVELEWSMKTNMELIHDSVSEQCFTDYLILGPLEAIIRVESTCILQIFSSFEQ